MRTYTVNFASGKSKEYQAESDSLHPGGAVVLSRKVAVEGEGGVLTTATNIEIVAVVSIANVEDYTFTENA